jgi:hypothetical protein
MSAASAQEKAPLPAAVVHGPQRRRLGRQSPGSAPRSLASKVLSQLPTSAAGVLLQCTAAPKKVLVELAGDAGATEAALGKSFACCV